MVRSITKRLSQLFRAYILSFNKNITLRDKWNFRLSSHARFGGMGRIVCMGGAEILDNAAIMSATKEALIEFGKNVFVNRNVIIACRKHVVIGESTVIGPNVVIYDHDHRFDANGRVKVNASSPYKESDVVIGKNVWLGAGAIILRGTTIGDNSIIAAGAIVKGNIPGGVIVRRGNNNIIETLKGK